jgi:hypothetical protein
MDYQFAEMLKTMHYDWYACIRTWEIWAPISSWYLSFLKSWRVGINFNDFFILAYSSHIMWAGPLDGFCCSFLYLKGCQLYLIFLERESWSQPYRVFFIAPQLDHAPKCSIGFTFGVRICEGRFDIELFSCRIFGISKLFRTQKSFWY